MGIFKKKETKAELLEGVEKLRGITVDWNDFKKDPLVLNTLKMLLILVQNDVLEFVRVDGSLKTKLDTIVIYFDGFKDLYIGYTCFGFREYESELKEILRAIHESSKRTSKLRREQNILRAKEILENKVKELGLSEI